MEIKDILLLRLSLYQSLCDCEYVDDCISECLMGRFRRFTNKYIVDKFLAYWKDDCICTIINEILKERMKIYLEPYSKKVDIYNLILNGALLLFPNDFIFGELLLFPCNYINTKEGRIIAN